MVQTNSGKSTFNALSINATKAVQGNQFYCQMDHGDLRNRLRNKSANLNSLINRKRVIKVH